MLRLAGCQSGGAISKLEKSKPGATVQPTSVQSPSASADCHQLAGTIACGRSPARMSVPSVSVSLPPPSPAAVQCKGRAGIVVPDLGGVVDPVPVRALAALPADSRSPSNGRAPPFGCRGRSATYQPPSGAAACQASRMIAAGCLSDIRNYPCACGFRQRPRCVGRLSMPRLLRIAGSAARRNGLVAFPAPSVVGAREACLRRAAASISAARSFSAALSGSMVSGETGVGQRVFVAEIDGRVVRQRRKLRQRMPHRRPACPRTAGRSRAQTGCRRQRAACRPAKW